MGKAAVRRIAKVADEWVRQLSGESDVCMEGEEGELNGRYELELIWGGEPEKVRELVNLLFGAVRGGTTFRVSTLFFYYPEGQPKLTQTMARAQEKGLEPEDDVETVKEGQQGFVLHGCDLDREQALELLQVAEEEIADPKQLEICIFFKAESTSRESS